jgi:hypothetical protein
MQIRKFLFKAALLILPVLLAFAYAEYKLKQIPNSYTVKKQLLEKRLDRIEALTVGGSHAYSGLNPKFWGCQGFNMANVDQDLFFDQQLINKYLDRMPNLKIVILPISYITLEFQLEDSPEDWRRFFYSQTYNVASTPHPSLSESIEPKKYSLIALYTIGEAQKFTFKMFQVNDLTDTIDENGFIEVDESNWPLLNERGGRERMELHHRLMKTEHIAENLKILNSIITQLQARHIAVTLVSTPVYRAYSSYMNKEKYQLMQENVRALTVRYGIKYFNYQFDPRFELRDFADTDHLNGIGAQKLSKIMAQDFIMPLLAAQKQTD